MSTKARLCLYINSVMGHFLSFKFLLNAIKFALPKAVIRSDHTVVIHLKLKRKRKSSRSHLKWRFSSTCPFLFLKLMIRHTKRALLGWYPHGLLGLFTSFTKVFWLLFNYPIELGLYIQPVSRSSLLIYIIKEDAQTEPSP